MKIATQNTEWGFWGTMALAVQEVERKEVLEAVWDAAVEAIVDHAVCSRTAARDLLDSRYGRHLADAAIARNLYGTPDLAQAVREAVAELACRRIRFGSYKGRIALFAQLDEAAR